MAEGDVSKPVVSVLGKAPNWFHSGIMGVDEGLGVIYYCAEEFVFALHAADLSYLAAWPAHSKRTHCLAVASSSTGPSLVTGGSDNVVRLWAPKLHNRSHFYKQEPIFEHSLHEAEICAVQWSSDSQTVISADASGKVVVFTPRTGKTLVTSLCHTRIACMDLVGEGGHDLLAVGDVNGNILVCRSVSGALPKPQHRLYVNGKKPFEVKWQPRGLGAGDVLAVTSEDGTLRVWTDFAAPPLIRSSIDPKGKKPTHPWISLAWIRYEGESGVVFGSPEGKLNFWTPFSKKPICNFLGQDAHKGHSRSVFSLVPFATSNGARVVSTSMDRTIILWSYEKLIHSINTLGGPVRSLDFASWQPTLAAVGVADKVIRLWGHQEASAYFKRTLWRAVQSTVCKVAFHPAEGGVLAFANVDGLVGVFDGIFLDSVLGRGEKVYKCPVRNSGPSDMLQWVPMNWVATNTSSEEISALVSFSVKGSAVCNFYPRPTVDPCLSPLFTERLTKIASMVFAANHAWVAVGYFSGEVRVFRMPSFTAIYSSTCGESSVLSLEWSQDDGTLAAGHRDGNIFLHAASRFSAEGGVIVPYPQPSRRLVGQVGRVLSLNWSPHREDLLCSGDSSGNTYVWDSIRCVPLASFKSGPAATLCVRWSPLDPDLVFTCSENGIAWQWSMSLNPFDGFPRQEIDAAPVVTPICQKRKREDEWAPIILAPPAAKPGELLELVSNPTPLPSQDKAYYLKLWEGRTLESLEEMASQREPQPDLTKWLLHLALSPLAGPEAHSYALLQTAQAYRTKDGDPHIAASLFASAGHIADAIECLTSKDFYLDAVALAQSRLPKGHAHLVKLYLDYAQHLLRTKSFEEACRWFILGEDVGSAINALASRGTRDSLLLALELSLKKDHETYPLRVWRYALACQAEGVHGEAALALFKLPASLPTAACLIFTLTDGSYIYTNSAPVENEDIIDIDDCESDHPPALEKEQIVSMWSKFGLTLTQDRQISFQNKSSPLETFSMSDISHFLGARMGDRSDEKGLEVYKFICHLSKE